MQSPKTGRKEVTSPPNQIQNSHSSARDVSPLRPIQASSSAAQGARASSISPQAHPGNAISISSTSKLETKTTQGQDGVLRAATGDLDDLSRLGISPTPPRGGRSNSKELNAPPTPSGAKPTFQPDLPLPRAFLRHTESPLSTVVIPPEYYPSDTIKAAKPKIAFAEVAEAPVSVAKGEKLPSYNDVEAEDSTGTIKRTNPVVNREGIVLSKA